MKKGNSMETNLVMEGVKFMFLGMGTVFIFLIVLILFMNLMSYIVYKFFPEPQPSLETEQTGVKQDNNKQVVAAITAAIKHHRKG